MKLNNMTPKEVMQSIRKQFYDLEYSKTVLNRLQESIDDFDPELASGCNVVTGESGVGKSTISKELVRRNPGYWEKGELGDILIQPVIWVAMCRNANPRDTAARIAKSLGVKGHKSGTEKSLTLDIIDMTILRKTRHFAIDETQHINVNSFDGKDDVRHLFKDITNHTSAGLTFFGMPGTEDIVLEELQLDSRFSSHIHIPHYDLKTIKNLEEFKSILFSIDKNSPFEPSHLDSPEMASYLFVASKGILRTLLRIIGYAGKYAHERGSKTIKKCDFVPSFRNHGSPSSYAIANPFEMTFSNLLKHDTLEETVLPND